MKKKLVLMASIILLMIGPSAHSSTLFDQISTRLVNAGKIDSSDYSFGEKIDLQSGAVDFYAMDVDLSTNSKLRVQFGRKLETESIRLKRRGYEDYLYKGKTDPAEIDREILANWTVDIPYIGGIFDLRDGWVGSKYPDSYGNNATTPNRCSKASAPIVRSGAWPRYYTYIEPQDYWVAPRINIPGVAADELLKINSYQKRPTDQVYYGSTTSNMRVSCLSSVNNDSGEGFKVLLPDGTAYYFDWMVSLRVPSINASPSYSVYYDPSSDNGIPIGSSSDQGGVIIPRAEYRLYASKIVDRFGNFIKYNFDNDHTERIISIESNDGVRITFEYNESGRIKYIRNGQRKWAYSYNESSYPGRIDSVDLPDGGSWKYVASGSGSMEDDEKIWTGCILRRSSMSSDQAPPGYLETIITNPAGAVGSFKFRQIIHGTNRTPGKCSAKNSDATPEIKGPASAWVVKSLFEKKVNGIGIAPVTWTYAYFPSWSWESDCSQNVCPATSGTRVTRPNGPVQEYVFGNDYMTNDKKIMSYRIYEENSLVSITDYTYLMSSSGQSYGDNYGVSFNKQNAPSHYKILPVASLSVTEGGVKYQAINEVFDDMARPTRITRKSVVVP